MNQRFGTLFAVLGLSLLLMSCAPPQAAEPSPVPIIRSLYQPYLARNENTPAWYRAMPMTPELAALVAQDQRNAHGEVGAIDADPIIAAQDFELSNLTVALDAPPANGHAVVTAHFNNLGEATEVHFDMVQRPADHNWLVDNVRSGDSNLRAELQPHSG